jgi:all-trans-retinol 13,14-reductase
MQPAGDPWDAIVIGSGMGGLACAAALAKTGHRVLVLEQHSCAGGLTQTFARAGFTWDVGLHYLGEFEPGGSARELVDWLSDGHLQFASMGAVYDTVHFPGGFQFAFARPEAALRADLAQKFPDAAAQIDAVFEATAAAVRAGRVLMMRRAMPGFVAKLLGAWHHHEIDRWWGRTVAQVLDERVSDPKLRALLVARQGDYGGLAAESSFGVFAMVTHHYFAGAYYPVGGAAAMAQALVPVVEGASGEVRLRSRVERLLLEQGRVAGVRLADGTHIACPTVVSDVGVRNTVARLLPEELRDSPWAREALSLKPSMCHVTLYLGLEGDIGAYGATASNHWFCETWDPDAYGWRDPATQPQAPQVFVSFASLKDPRHDPGARVRHTAEVVCFVPWELFAPWEDSALGRRPEGYTRFKSLIEGQLLAQFAAHFPRLAPMVVYHELSTPLSTIAFTGAQQGAIYGLESSPRRYLSQSLRVKTPLPGLFLAGQDVCTPGVMSAMMGGVLAAGVVDPRVFTHLG